MLSEAQPTLQNYNITTLQHYSPRKTYFQELSHHCNITTLRHKTSQPQKDVLSGSYPTLQHNNITTLQHNIPRKTCYQELSNYCSPRKACYQELSQHCNTTKLQHYNITAPERRAIRSSAHIATSQYNNITTLQPQKDV